MDRIYTAFVSSTYLDLVRERASLANTLLSQDCVPLGMEFFPSTGADQWEPILDSISSADFCVFMVAGRYGSIVPGSTISWTHREFRETVAQGKPLIALLHGDINQIPAGRVDPDPSRRSSLEDFRREIESTAGCRYFTDESELISGLYMSVAALKRDEKIEGWIPAGKRPVLVQETDFVLTYDLIEIEHILKPSLDPNRLDSTYSGRRVLRGNAATGVKSISQNFSRASDAIPFDDSNQPTIAITESNRSGPGSVRLARARKTHGASFTQDVLFVPPLGLDEVADISVSAELPRYKVAFSEDLFEASLRTSLGPTGFDFAARLASFPIKELVLRVFLPHTTSALPAGPKVGTGSTIDDLASADLVSKGCYTEWPATVGGEPGIFAQLKVPKPRFNRTYRICWTLPSRP